MPSTPSTSAALTAAIALSVVSHSAFADIEFFFTEAPDGGTLVAGTGSGLVNREAGIASSDWDIQDFLTNFLQETFTDVQTGAGTVSGSFTNVTSGISETIISFDVDRDGGLSNDNDLDFDTANVLSFDFEDEFTLTLSATFSVSELPFDQLVLGTHIDVGRTQGAGIAEESFGITTVNVVPAPATGLLMFATLPVLTRRRRN